MERNNFDEELDRVQKESRDNLLNYLNTDIKRRAFNVLRNLHFDRCTKERYDFFCERFRQEHDSLSLTSYNCTMPYSHGFKDACIYISNAFNMSSPWFLIYFKDDSNSERIYVTDYFKSLPTTAWNYAPKSGSFKVTKLDSSDVVEALELLKDDGIVVCQSWLKGFFGLSGKEEKGVTKKITGDLLHNLGLAYLWAKYAAVNKNGDLVVFDNEPKCLPQEGCWCSFSKVGVSEGRFEVVAAGYDASDWQHSLVEKMK